MPLSEHEQRLLEQMERALYQEDPKFASSLRHARSGGLDRRRVALGAVGTVAGLALVLVGVATSLPVVGVLGFVVMVAGSVWAWSATRTEPAAMNGAAGPQTPTPSARPFSTGSKAAGQSAFMTKMEQRWRKRREGEQGH